MRVLIRLQNRDLAPQFTKFFARGSTFWWWPTWSGAKASAQPAPGDWPRAIRAWRWEHPCAVPGFAHGFAGVLDAGVGAQPLQLATSHVGEHSQLLPGHDLLRMACSMPVRANSRVATWAMASPARNFRRSRRARTLHGGALTSRRHGVILGLRHLHGHRLELRGCGGSS